MKSAKGKYIALFLFVGVIAFSVISTNYIANYYGEPELIPSWVANGTTAFNMLLLIIVAAWTVELFKNQ